jgi:hypothetical protein
MCDNQDLLLEGYDIILAASVYTICMPERTLQHDSNNGKEWSNQDRYSWVFDGG